MVICNHKYNPLSEEELYLELKKIHNGLKDKDATIKFECFNKEEVEQIKSHLLPHEKSRVIFSWLAFKSWKKWKK